MSFKDKVVIVIGASSGIGAATAVAFSDEGARVVLVGRDQTRLADVASRCSNPLVVRADITKDDEAQSIIEETTQKFGKIDILINNAGVLAQGSLLDGDIMKGYDFAMSVYLRAVIYITKLAAPYLIKSKGNIVNISSVACLKPPKTPNVIPYCVSKAALCQFSTCAAVELAPHGVRVNTVSPGPVKTEIFKTSEFDMNWDDLRNVTSLKRVSEPEEIADLILYLVSDKAIAVTGSNYVSDNGALLI